MKNKLAAALLVGTVIGFGCLTAAAIIAQMERDRIVQLKENEEKKEALWRPQKGKIVFDKTVAATIVQYLDDETVVWEKKNNTLWIDMATGNLHISISLDKAICVWINHVAVHSYLDPDDHVAIFNAFEKRSAKTPVHIEVDKLAPNRSR